MAQKLFKATIVPASGGGSIEVTVPANDTKQAKKLIEQTYGPIKAWYKDPRQVG